MNRAQLWSTVGNGCSTRPKQAGRLSSSADAQEKTQIRVLLGETMQSSLVEQIERIGHALTADDVAKLLSVSRITIFKQAKAGRIPSFRIGTCVRFDPKIAAEWLRKQ